MKMTDLIESIHSAPSCSVARSAGLPTISPGHECPPDLEQFYRVCGGVDLFSDSTYGLHISSPLELVPANPIIIGQQIADDISSSWYVIGRGDNSQFVTIDLHPARIGRCYDSFWDRHGVVGSCPVIALTFQELLERSFRNKGGHWYWLQSDFESLGDAYD